MIRMGSRKKKSAFAVASKLIAEQDFKSFYSTGRGRTAKSKNDQDLGVLVAFWRH